MALGGDLVLLSSSPEHIRVCCSAAVGWVLSREAQSMWVKWEPGKPQQVPQAAGSQARTLGCSAE